MDPDPGPGMFNSNRAGISVAATIGQILLLDLVFSVDSIITAVGMTDDIPIMVIAVAVTVTLLAARPLAEFIHRNPTLVMLALAFLLRRKLDPTPFSLTLIVATDMSGSLAGL